MKHLSILAMLLIPLVSTGQEAQSAASPSSSTAATQNSSTGQTLTLAEVVKQLQQALAARDAAIVKLSARVDALERELRVQRAEESGTTKPVTVAEAGLAVAPAAPARDAPTQDYDQEERLARAALDRTLISRGGLLVPKWTVEVEHSFTYYNASSDRLTVDGFAIFPVLIVGDIVSESVRRDILLGAETARVGLPRNWQLDVRVPYGYESKRTTTADNQQSSQHVLGIGDIEVGMTRQLTRNNPNWPDLLAAIRWKGSTGSDPYQLSATNQPVLGTGFQSLQGSLTAIKQSDPLVFFSALSYSASLPATKQFQQANSGQQDTVSSGVVRPGDTIGFSLGAALSVNPEASFNIGWDQRFTRKTTLNSMPLPGTFLTGATLRLGTSYVYSAGRAIDLGIGVGMTRDVPDFQFSISTPFRFSLIHKPSAK